MKQTLILIVLLRFFSVNQSVAQHPRLTIHSYATRSGKAIFKKGKYNMGQFIGRWQETARMKTNTKERTAVVDTFYIRFYNNNTADTKEGRSVMISGTSEIFTDDYITTSAADFKIVSVSPDVIVLDDMRGYQHSLSRTNHFAYETGNEPPPTPANNADNKVDLSPSSLIKNWFAYRRAADPGVVKAGTPLIRYLRIQEKISADRYKAEVEFARNGKAYVQQCILTFTDKTVLIETEGSTWNIQVYKADGKEMILGTKGELIYYFTNLDQ